MRQASFEFRTWGGKRKGAGRKPNGPRARLRHARRPVLKSRFPVHVTWRMRHGIWNLRTRRCFTALAAAFWGGANRFGFKHYGQLVPDAYTSTVAVIEPDTFLMRRLC